MGSKIGVQKVAAKRIGLSVEEYLGNISSGLKWCTKCKSWKPKDEFFKDSSRSDGLSSRCMICQCPTSGKVLPKRLYREKSALGLSFCRKCHAWRPKTEITNGLCRDHWNEYNREKYRTDPVYRANRRQHVHSRKRGFDPIPAEVQEQILDEFNGLCAYCGNPAESWDHIVPISKGGGSTPGNIVPACIKCNSSKKDQEVDVWMKKQGFEISPKLLDRIVLAYAGLYG